MTKNRLSLDAPPVGELDEEITALDPIDPQVVLLLIIVDAHIKNSAGIQLVAQEDAVVDFFVVVVVVGDQTEREVSGDLVTDALSEYIDTILQLSTPALVEGIIPEIIEEPQVCDGLERQIETIGVFVSQVGILIIVDTVSNGKINPACEPG